MSFRMAMHMGEGFLDNPEHGPFDFLWEVTPSVRKAQIHGKTTALGEEFCVCPQAGGKTSPRIKIVRTRPSGRV